MGEPGIVLAVTAALTFLLAGFVKGVIGLGLPTVAIGLLGLFMTPTEAAALLVVPSLVTNIWQLAAGPAFLPLVRRLWPMLLCFCIGTWAGAGGLNHGSMSHAGTLLGVALIAYALLGLSAKQFSVPPSAERWWSPVVGIATGLVAVTTGVFVVPAVPYLQALGLNKDDLVQALGLSFTVSTVALGSVLLAGGFFKPAVAASSLFALAPAIAGMLAGQWVRSRVRAEQFRVYFFAGLLLLGAHLALRHAF
ncbi:sulfite exporter TauE/SafE family protein [Noviherbaspirillum sp. ST9]|uniref:sulfite exporter TauE/SafE family protein n=1 Tax=Noviherbaspirillum sp. ST9 TaxID=3401606 RepID=UPI003B588C7F